MSKNARRSFAPETVVDRALAAGDPTSARRYASRLARLVDLLDERFGKSPLRTVSPTRRRVRKLRGGIELVQRANPDWSASKIAVAFGVSSDTVRLYLKGMK